MLCFRMESSIESKIYGKNLALCKQFEPVKSCSIFFYFKIGSVKKRTIFQFLSITLHWQKGKRDSLHLDQLPGFKKRIFLFIYSLNKGQ